MSLARLKVIIEEANSAILESNYHYYYRLGHRGGPGVLVGFVNGASLLLFIIAFSGCENRKTIRRSVQSSTFGTGDNISIVEGFASVGSHG